MKRELIVVLCIALAVWANAQSTEWLTTGNTGQDPVTDFLGNQDAIPMNIRTEDILRFRLNYDETYTIGSFTAQVKNGNFLLSPDVDQFYINGAPGPYSLLHLASGSYNAQQQSYRPWMRTGISFTGNNDHSYVGQKSGGAIDDTDMIIHWSDNPGFISGPDRLRFIFTSGYNVAALTGASSAEGLEAMRLYPASNDEVLVGVGDWYAAGIEPTERLDILDRTIRIQRLVPDYRNDTLSRIVVTDGNGRLHWRDINSWPPPEPAQVFRRMTCATIRHYPERDRSERKSPTS